MGREFICHRCGTANRRGAENCSYCGLQVGWRPSVPDWLRFWQWPVPLCEQAGGLAAFGAFALAIYFPGAWITSYFAPPLIIFSCLALVSHLLAPATGDGERR